MGKIRIKPLHRLSLLFERSEGLQSPHTFLFFLSDPPATVGSLMSTRIFTPNWPKYGLAGDFELEKSV
jgi:hypothetical protein